jgi:hypothetical protein
MTVADVAAARRDQVPRGIAYMVGSTAMFAGGNAVVKRRGATRSLAGSPTWSARPRCSPAAMQS